MDRVRLNSTDDSRFSQAWELYRESFPIYEQRRLEEQAQAMAQPDYHFEVLYQAGRFVGIMLYWRHMDFVYLEHFAVTPALRGGGLGTKALGLLLDEGARVILEIDPVRDDVSRRRLKFYQGLGLAQNPYKHIHPPYRDGYNGHSLEVLSSGGELEADAYNEFAFYLNNRVMEYAQK